MAIVLVIILHAAIEPHPIVTEITQAEVWRWWTINIYNSLARVCVPLFVMVSGALLLDSRKNESLNVFFRKRVGRIALTFAFWSIAYFAWRFFINNEAVSYETIVEGFISGPYYHFWFFYMLVGLYLITPILRVVVANSNRKTLKYFIGIWFFGTAIVPLFSLQASISLENNLFVLVGWIGYYFLGEFLKTIKLRKTILYGLLFLGWSSTIIATYFITLYMGGINSYFFYDYLSLNVILASIALFTLLYQIPNRKFENISSRAKWLIGKLGQNTLPIYMLHVMILEVLQQGYFGFTISVTTMNPALEVPLITAITLFTCLGIVLVLKRIPFVEKIIG